MEYDMCRLREKENRLGKREVPSTPKKENVEKALNKLS